MVISRNGTLNKPEENTKLKLRFGRMAESFFPYIIIIDIIYGDNYYW